MLSENGGIMLERAPHAGMSCSSSSSRSCLCSCSILDPLGSLLHRLSITRTRTTTRTRNHLPGISGICHSSGCTQTAPQGPLFPSMVSDKA